LKFYKYIEIVFLIFISATIDAQTDDTKPSWIELHGYIKYIQNTTFVQEIDSNASTNLIHNRLNFKFNIAPKITSRLEIRNRIFYGEQIEQTPNFGDLINQDSGYFDLSHLWVNEDSFVAQSTIDRMLVQYYDEKWDVIIGRQRINWGINTVWNPNDLFNAFNLLEFDYEERPGSDAVRIQHNLKNNASFELAYEASKNNDEQIVALLYKWNRKKYDFQLLTGIYQTDFVIGGGWAGSIKEAGFKGEMSYFIPKQNSLDSSENFCLSLMADQTFKKDWYASITMLYNSNPTNAFLISEGIYNFNVSAKMLFPFRYNFHFTALKTISPISSFNFSFIYSPEKNTLILIPSFTWNVATDFDLDFMAQSFFADQIESYENLGTNIFIRSRWSF
jgi:hypothetical protein